MKAGLVVFDIRKFLLLVFSILWLATHSSYAQNDEIWPELDVSYRPNEKLRFFAALSATRRESQNADGTFNINVDYFTFPYLRKIKNTTDSARGYYQWLRVGYSYGMSSAVADEPFKESMINLESNSRFHIPGNVLVTLKNRLDSRFYNHDFSERYRPKLTIERDFKTEYLTFTMYVYGEYFVYIAQGDHNKGRACLGAELMVAKSVSFEAYFLRQFAVGDNSSNLHAAGFALKFYFMHKKVVKQHTESILEDKVRVD